MEFGERKSLALPNFRGQTIVIVGAQRSGTSFLADSLAGIPGVCRYLTDRGEPRFWLGENPKAAEFVARCRDQYPDGNLPSHLLEKATTYLDFPIVASTLQDEMPNVKIVAILREPLLRAISNYKFSQASGVENLPLLDALRADFEGVQRPFPKEISTNPYQYLSRGQYEKVLPQWFQTIPRGNLELVIFEHLTSKHWDWAKFLSRLTFSQDQIKQFRPSRQRNSSRSAALLQISGPVLAEFQSMFVGTYEYLRSEGIDIEIWDELQSPSKSKRLNG